MTSELSVIMPVYSGSKPGELSHAIESVFDQTRPPDELLVVQDGPLTPRARDLVTRFADRESDRIRIVRLEENQGVGIALREGVKACSSKFFARMDADDVSINSRFEWQLAFLKENPEIAGVGGFIAEYPGSFDTNPRIRKVPLEADDIREYARFRSPINHVTVMLRRDTVLDVGNYRDVASFEDYELWARLLTEGYELANLPEVFVECRVDGLAERRGGWQYAKSEFVTQRQLLNMGFIPKWVFLTNLIVRIPLRLAPDNLRSATYHHFLRS